MRYAIYAVLLALAGCVLGCAGNAHLAIQSADTLTDVATQLETVVREYHTDVAQGDDIRESSVASAFVARVKSNPANEAKDVSEFLLALNKIRADRETEFDRRNAALGNLGLLREIAKGLNRVGVDSLSLNDEVRRYITSWGDGYAKYKETKAAQSAANAATKQQQRDAVIQQGVDIIGQPAAQRAATGGVK